MKRSTVERLERINREFYRAHAAAFGATRGAAWPGWRRLAARLRERPTSDGRPPAILDLGCGNGRLAPFLEAELDVPVDWVGVDASPELLEQARRHTAAGARELVRAELTPATVAALSPGRDFDLVAILALLHHLPSQARRCALVAAAAARVAPGGTLALSFWRFAGRRRFERRRVPWSKYNARVPQPIEVGDLEPGDLLQAWGGDAAERTTAVRYCHQAGEGEVATIIEASGLEPVERYAADGREGDLNLYWLLERETKVGGRVVD